LKWIKKNPEIKYNDNDDIITKLLKIYGIKNPKFFFNPNEESLNDPYQLKNIDILTDRIIQAVKNKEKICISVDSDFDGIAGSTMFYRYLSNFTNNVYLVWSDERKHGIEHQIKKIDNDTDLLIIIDSSTNSSETCQYLSKEKNIDILIIDHHGFDVANYYATIVNPQMDDYPNKELSGTAVAWKVLQVLDDKLNVNFANDYIDLTGFSLVADVMCHKEVENRYLIQESFNNINNLGLKTIMQVMNVKEMNTQTIGYMIAPLINGAVRLNQIDKAIQLLLSDNLADCGQLAHQLKEFNEKRKIVEESIFDEVFDSAKEQVKNNNNVIIIEYEKNINSNYNGLVASRISSYFHRPVLFLVYEGENLKGSFRSSNFNMRDALKDFKEVFYSLGHPPAGGTMFPANKKDIVQNKLNELLKNEDLDPVYQYDLEVFPKDITNKLLKASEKFNLITGRNFPPVKFKVNNLVVQERAVIGKNNDTIKFNCIDNITGEEINAIKFKTSDDWKSNLSFGDKIEVLGQINLNKYFSYRDGEVIQKQIIMDDIRIAE